MREEQTADRMTGGDIERCRDDRLLGAGPDQAGIRAHAQCQSQRVEEDRFTGAGFARQNTHS